MTPWQHFTGHWIGTVRSFVQLSAHRARVRGPGFASCARDAVTQALRALLGRNRMKSRRGLVVQLPSSDARCPWYTRARFATVCRDGPPLALRLHIAASRADSQSCIGPPPAWPGTTWRLALRARLRTVLNPSPFERLPENTTCRSPYPSTLIDFNNGLNRSAIAIRHLGLIAPPVLVPQRPSIDREDPVVRGSWPRVLRL